MRSVKASSQADNSQTKDVEDAEVSAEVDESYISALEWGLPPTGGWGCGIDRVVMLFSGKKRIADVLPFGTLTNVAALGSEYRTRKEDKKKKK